MPQRAPYQGSRGPRGRSWGPRRPAVPQLCKRCEKGCHWMQDCPAPPRVRDNCYFLFFYFIVTHSRFISVYRIQCRALSRPLRHQLQDLPNAQFATGPTMHGSAMPTQVLVVVPVVAGIWVPWDRFSCLLCEQLAKEGLRLVVEDGGVDGE